MKPTLKVKPLLADLRRWHRQRHSAEHALHIGYCALVFIEGHSFYAIVAGLLAVILILNLALGGDPA